MDMFSHPTRRRRTPLGVIRLTGIAVLVFVSAAGTPAPSYTQTPDATGETRVQRNPGVLIADCFGAPGNRCQPQKSVGHGWPVPVKLNAFDGYPEEYFVGAVTP